MIVTGIFPDNLKISKVIRLYKAKDQTLLSNYRPIALLPSISKIFEYVLLEQITNYLLDNNMLSPQQYGFRSNHSTELAALNLVDELTYKLDRGIILMNIYIFQHAPHGGWCSGERLPRSCPPSFRSGTPPP